MVVLRCTTRHAACNGRIAIDAYPRVGKRRIISIALCHAVSATATQIGPYVAVAAAGPIEIDRRESGVRHAVWYSALAGVVDGRVEQFDKECLRVMPA